MLDYLCCMLGVNITIFAEAMRFMQVEEIYKTSMIASSGCQRNCASWTYENEVQDMEKEGKILNNRTEHNKSQR